MSSIAIFTVNPVEQLDPDEIRAAVTESNSHTLCDQYCLDPALIEPAMTYLDIRVPVDESATFFSLHFAPEPAVPIIVKYWCDNKDIALRVHTYSAVAPEGVREHLVQSKEVFAVDLSQPGGNDLGILFAYELARWIAFKGDGVVYAFDGVWYRLNAHKAFLPVS